MLRLFQLPLNVGWIHALYRSLCYTKLPASYDEVGTKLITSRSSKRLGFQIYWLVLSYKRFVVEAISIAPDSVHDIDDPLLMLLSKFSNNHALCPIRSHLEQTQHQHPLLSARLVYTRI